jgi:hypothetical protein
MLGQQHPDNRATPFGRGPDMVLREMRYGKPVALLFIQTASTCVLMPLRENRIIVDLGLL